MNNAHKKEAETLITFKTYLLTQAGIAESTASDYVKRIVTISKEEGKSIEELSENINAIVYDYTEGEKQERGQRSHNSYRSALLKFQAFMAQGGTIKSTHVEPKYRFDVNQVPGELFGTIKLYDQDGNLLDTQTTLDKHHYEPSKMTRDLAEKCIKMMFDKVYNKDATKLFEVLRMLDCSLTVSGKKIIL